MTDTNRKDNSVRIFEIFDTGSSNVFSKLNEARPNKHTPTSNITDAKRTIIALIDIISQPP